MFRPTSAAAKQQSRKPSLQFTSYSKNSGILQHISHTVSHTFQPVAVENLDPIDVSILTFLNSLGQRMRTVSGDDRETLLVCFIPTNLPDDSTFLFCALK